ncbi:hypothetical protein ACWOEF_16470 [Enterococcus crotali]
MPLFHEIYGQYFAIAEKILRQLPLNKNEIQQMIEENGYGETPFHFSDAFFNEEDAWHLVKPDAQDYQSILRQLPQRPVTLLEKQWLKTILQDEKISLFLTEAEQLHLLNQLQEVSVLFGPEDTVYYDQFQTDDRFQDTEYQRNIHLLVEGIQKRLYLEIDYQGLENQTIITHKIKPDKIEYSHKNNKFRLKAKRQTRRGNWENCLLNVSEIQAVRLLAQHFENENLQRTTEKSITCLLKDERDTLERAIFHFSNYRKVTQKLEGEAMYQLTIFYLAQDETELLIQVMSFGPFLKVTAPNRFIQQIQYRLRKQRELFYPKYLDQ